MLLFLPKRTTRGSHHKSPRAHADTEKICEKPRRAFGIQWANFADFENDKPLKTLNVGAP
jgi:hypothetical protein